MAKHEAVKDQGQMAEAPQTEAKPEAPKAVTDIIRGRMPVAVVYDVRFNKKNADKSAGALAVKYGTTTGKIVDIQKNYNFGYVTESFKATKAQKEEAETWLKKHPKFADGAVAEIMDDINERPEASAEEAAAFLNTRVAARGQLTTTKTGETANAGGGNRRKAGAKEVAGSEKKPEIIDKETKLTADELLK